MGQPVLKPLVHAVDNVAHATAVDRVVHKATGGARLVQKDGNATVGEFAVGSFEHVAHETGFDHTIHFFTKGERVLNEDGSFNPTGAIRAMKNTAHVIKHLPEEIAMKFLEIIQQIIDAVHDAGEVAINIIRDIIAQFQAALKLVWDNFIWPYIRDDVDRFKQTMQPVTDDLMRLMEEPAVQSLFSGQGVRASVAGHDAHLHDPGTDFQGAVQDLGSDTKGEVYHGASESGKAVLDAIGPLGRSLVEGTALKFREISKGEKSGSIGVGWGIGGGLGLKGQASAEANMALKDFLSQDFLQWTGMSSVCASVGVGLEIGVELNTGPFFAINLDDPPDLGGFGFEFFGGLAVYGGLIASVNFTIAASDAGVLGIYPSGITIMPIGGVSVGLAGGVNLGVAFTYKHVILSTNKALRGKEACKYDNVEWSKLPTPAREAAETLGFDQYQWDNEIDPPQCEVEWRDLASGEQEAAAVLGYNYLNWG